jgi:coenzyme PQQ precursor peptide PqqA
MTALRSPIHLSYSYLKELLMTWTTPKVTEVTVGMEINCYACAELTR